MTDITNMYKAGALSRTSARSSYFPLVLGPLLLRLLFLGRPVFLLLCYADRRTIKRTRKDDSASRGGPVVLREKLEAERYEGFWQRLFEG
jgi:hypothetical protein